MEDDATTDQAGGGIPAEGAQPAPAGIGAPAADQTAQQAVGEGDIVIGNQRFTRDSLAKAYSELQRGFTQKTQEYNRKLGAYSAYDKWLRGLSDEEYRRFADYVKAGGRVAGTAQHQQQEQSVQRGEDPRYAELHDEMQSVKAGLEYSDFRANHPELSKDQVDKVVQFVIDKDQEGEEYWKLEMAHRWLSHEENAAKLVSLGQKQAQDANAKGRQAVTLGASPAAAQVAARQKRDAQGKKSWHQMSERERTDFVASKMDESGISKSLSEE